MSLCIRENRSKKRLSNSYSDCKIYFKNRSQKNLLCFSIAKLTDYAISLFTISKLMALSLMVLVAKTINARLLDEMTFFRNYFGV